MSEILILIISILIILEFFSKNNISIFYFLSLYFILFFYSIPLLLIDTHREFYYLGLHYKITSLNINWLFLYMIIFLAGFYVMRLKKIEKNSDFKRTWNHNRILFWIGLSISYLILISLYLYFSNYSEYSSEYRSGSIKINKFLALSIIISIPISIYAITIIDHIYKNKYYSLALSLNLIYISYNLSGRIIILQSIYITLLILVKWTKFPILIGSIVSLLTLPYLLNLKILLSSFQKGEGFDSFLTAIKTSDLRAQYIDNFGFQLMSAIKIDELVELIGCRLFYDYVHGFVFYLRAFGFNTGDSLAYYNTYILFGVQESIIPPGYITMGYIQFGLIGIFVSGLFFGLLGRSIMWIYQSTAINSRLFLFYLCFIAANTFYYGEIRIIVLNFIIPATILGGLILLSTTRPIVDK